MLVVCHSPRWALLVCLAWLVETCYRPLSALLTFVWPGWWRKCYRPLSALLACVWPGWWRQCYRPRSSGASASTVAGTSGAVGSSNSPALPSSCRRAAATYSSGRHSAFTSFLDGRPLDASSPDVGASVSTVACTSAFRLLCIMKKEYLQMFIVQSKTFYLVKK